MRITVFTPTFNRGYIIDNLYQSLQQQTFRDFEWIVVDDGSTDNTQELFNAYSKTEHDFPIKYIAVSNGGKHRAINKGLQIAQGELFFIVDSDDYLPHDSLAIIDTIEKSIPNEKKSRFAGVCGLRGINSSQLEGSTFDGDILDITTLERGNYCIFGDKAEVVYTNVFKRYPFPEFPGENFLTENVVWDRIAYDGYKFRFFNEVIYLGHNISDGLTNQGMRKYISNPYGYGIAVQQRVKFRKYSFKNRYLAYVNFYRDLKSALSMNEIADCINIHPFYLKIMIWFYPSLQYIYRLVKKVVERGAKNEYS